MKRKTFWGIVITLFVIVNIAIGYIHFSKVQDLEAESNTYQRTVQVTSKPMSVSSSSVSSSSVSSSSIVNIINPKDIVTESPEVTVTPTPIDSDINKINKELKESTYIKLTEKKEIGEGVNTFGISQNLSIELDLKNNRSVIKDKLNTKNLTRYTDYNKDLHITKKKNKYSEDEKTTTELEINPNKYKNIYDYFKGTNIGLLTEETEKEEIEGYTYYKKNITPTENDLKTLREVGYDSIEEFTLTYIVYNNKIKSIVSEMKVQIDGVTYTNKDVIKIIEISKKAIKMPKV